MSLNRIDYDSGQSDLDLWIANVLDRHSYSLIKASVVAVMLFFSVSTFSGSIWKGLLIAAISFMAALFATWRRYLEPISFLAFCAAVIFWCDPELPQHVKSAVGSFYASNPVR
jgi:hypothetical protein